MPTFAIPHMDGSDANEQEKLWTTFDHRLIKLSTFPKLSLYTAH